MQYVTLKAKSFTEIFEQIKAEYDDQVTIIKSNIIELENGETTVELIVDVENTEKITSEEKDLKVRYTQTAKHEKIFKGATLLISDPTHKKIVIGIKYTEDMSVAEVVLKTESSEAQTIISIIEEYNYMPIFEQTELTRVLYEHTQLNQPIPQSYYNTIAILCAAYYYKDSGLDSSISLETLTQDLEMLYKNQGCREQNFHLTYTLAKIILKPL